MTLVTLLVGTAAFLPGAHVVVPGARALAVHRCAVPQRQQQLVMMAKGFGPQKEAPKKKEKVAKAPGPKSAGAEKRDQAASDFEALKASGSPEYMVLVRECPEGAEPSKWYPVGSMAVPRSSSIDVTMSMAIFNNEDDLLKGAFRAFPFLKNSQNKFEYGYRLKEFPDDEVKIANKDATEPSDNPIMNWFNALDNPLNDGSGWFNPLNQK